MKCYADRSYAPHGPATHRVSWKQDDLRRGPISDEVICEPCSRRFAKLNDCKVTELPRPI